MKRKVLISTIVLSLLFAGIASAASLWGTYKGNNIIMIAIDGKPVKTGDIPAISYNGRTMIPIYLLSQAGINYTWNQQTKTVDIKKEGSGNDDEIKKVRAYAQFAYYYNEIDDLGQSISNLANLFEVVYNYYLLGTDPGFDINRAFEEFNNQSNRYNDRRSIVQMANEDGMVIGANGVELSEILFEYLDALDYFRASLKALEQISINGYSKTQHDIYFENASLGMRICHDASLNAYEGYHKYIKLASE